MVNGDHQTAIKLVNELSNVVSRTGYGVADQQISNLMRQLRPLATSNGYTLEKFGQLEVWIDRLCSPRKYEQWGGLNRVRQGVMSGCHKLASAFRLIDQL